MSLVPKGITGHMPASQRVYKVSNAKDPFGIRFILPLCLDLWVNVDLKMKSEGEKNYMKDR